MAKGETFSCSVITPERKLLEVNATFVALPAHDGEMGVLVNRAPLVCKLGIGVLRIETPAGKHVLYIDDGFAQVVDNRVTILTEEARPASEINTKEAEEALAAARTAGFMDETTYLARDRAVRRAKTQLKLVGK